MIDELNRNINTEIAILREIAGYRKRAELASPNEKRLLENAIVSLGRSMKIINGSIPKIMSNISTAKPLPYRKITTGLERVSFQREDREIGVTISSSDRERLFKELSINEGLMKKLKRKGGEEDEKYIEFKAARGYLKLSNILFLDFAEGLVKKGNFLPLKTEIKRANLDILFPTYIAMMILSSLLSFVVGLFLFAMFLVVNIGLTWPFFSLYSGEIFSRIVQTFWIPIALPAICFVFLYFYPTLEKGSVGARIDQELPFAVIHMSAIAGSGIAPVEIFKIIGMSKEYPYLRKEMRKILNQINLYGYDLVTALNETSKHSPSAKLAELFGGLSTTINSGGSLKEYFEKRSESLLLTYRLDREKYSKTAETLMDIYISVVIAAPMILMLLLIMIAVSGIGAGFTTTQATVLIILGLSLVNIGFLIFLHLKQPSY